MKTDKVIIRTKKNQSKCRIGQEEEEQEIEQRHEIRRIFSQIYTHTDTHTDTHKPHIFYYKSSLPSIKLKQIGSIFRINPKKKIVVLSRVAWVCCCCFFSLYILLVLALQKRYISLIFNRVLDQTKCWLSVKKKLQTIRKQNKTKNNLPNCSKFIGICTFCKTLSVCCTAV